MPRKGASEKLTDTNLQKVTELLEAKSPITKKQACEILGIAYNTSRLATLLESYKERKERTARKKAEKRYTPPTEDEIRTIVRDYLIDGDSVSVIAERIYRSSDFVNRILERVGVPKRTPGFNYFHPELIPDAAVRETFSANERAWSARYNTTVKVINERENQKGVYLVWVEGEAGQFYAFQPFEELGSLEHLKQYGI